MYKRQSPPFRPTTTIRSPPPTKRKPRIFHAGHRLGWARPSLPPDPSTTIFSRTTPLVTSTTTGHTETPSTPSPPQNLRRVYFCPRDRSRFASQLREWRRGRWRSSWIGFQAALRSPHHPPLAPPFEPFLILRRAFPSQSCHRSTAATGPLGSPPIPASQPPPAPTNWACPFKPPSTALGLLPLLFQLPRRRLCRG